MNCYGEELQGYPQKMILQRTLLNLYGLFPYIEDFLQLEMLIVLKNDRKNDLLKIS